MYTVKELIEALEKCPENYKVMIVKDFTEEPMEALSIDHHYEVIDIFGA